MVERYIISIDRGKAPRSDKNLFTRWENSSDIESRAVERKEIARDDEAVQLWRGSVLAVETDKWLNPPIYAISPGSVSTSILLAMRGPIRGTSHAMRRTRSTAPSSEKGSRFVPMLVSHDSSRSYRLEEPRLTLLSWNKKETDVSVIGFEINSRM